MTMTSPPPVRSSSQSVIVTALVPPIVMFFGFLAVRDVLAFQLVLVAFMCSLVVSLPVLLRRRGSLLEPIFLVLILVFFGVSLRLLVVSTQGSNELVRNKLLNGEPADVLFGGAVAVLVGLTALSLGYLANPALIRLDNTYLVQRPQWSSRRTRLSILGLTVLGLLGMFTLIRTFGLTEISAKRFNSLEGGAQQRSSSIAFIYFRMALLMRFALYILLIFRRQVSAKYNVLIPVLFVGAVFVPVYVNNRAGVALIVIDLLLIGYLGAGRFKPGQIARAAAFVGVSTVGILSVRGTRNSAVESTLFSRDLLDVSKTAQIIELEGGSLNGQTMYGWMAAPLPFETEAGEVWSNLGRYVWTNAYGQPGQNGVPAGFVGELYLNFGWPAIAIGCFLFGFLLRKLYVSFRPHLDIPGIGLLYALTLPRFTIFVLSNDFGTGFWKTFADLVPIMFFLWFVGERSGKRQRSEGSGQRVVQLREA